MIEGLVAQLGERLGQLYSLSHGGMYLTRQPRGSHPFVESLDKSAFLIEYGGVAQLGKHTVCICSFSNRTKDYHRESASS